jgi:acetoin utilization protein AcuB
MKIRDHMTREMLTVTPETPLVNALQLLQESKLRCLPVMHKDGVLVGLLLLSDADLARNNLELNVGDVMRPPTISIQPNQQIERAAVLMLEHDVRGLPVVDERGQLVGVLTVSDLLDVMVAHPPITLWS